MNKGREFDLNDLKDIRFDSFVNTHGLNLPVIFELGKKLGLNMPVECKITGIVAYDCKSFGEDISCKLKLKEEMIFNKIKENIYNMFGLK